MLHCKGLPESFKPFVVVVTQSDKEQTFTEFKAALKTHIQPKVLSNSI